MSTVLTMDEPTVKLVAVIRRDPLVVAGLQAVQRRGHRDLVPGIQ